MINVYLEDSYQKIITKSMARLRKQKAGKSFGDLAKFMRIEHSYLSKVIHEKAHFNSDQLYMVCRYFQFDEDEQNYLFLLLEYERCYIPSRKENLRAKFKKIQKQKIRTEKFLEKASTIDKSELEIIHDYYSKPLHQVLHIMLSITKYAKDPRLLVSALNLSWEHIQSLIHNLEEMGVIESKGGEIKLNKTHLHLSKDSEVYKHWIQQMRLLAMQRIAADQKNDGYNFSVVMSCDEQTHNQIQANFFEFIKETERLVNKAENEKTVQINFDLVPWC